MSIYASLHARFPQAWRDRIETAVYHSVIGRAEGVSVRAAEVSTAARLDGRLTMLGRGDKIRATLARDVAPLARDIVKVKSVPERAAARRRELLAEAVKAAPASADTISAAMIRGEMRRHIASLDNGQAMAWLATLPEADLAMWVPAILEAPAPLSGLSADMFGRIVADAAARLSDPVKLQAVKDHEEAASLADAALRYVMTELMAATALQPPAFTAWAIAEGAPAEAFDPVLVAAAERQGPAMVAKVGGAA